MNEHATHSLPREFDVFLGLLGRLNYTWTNTESLLIHFIAGLLGTDKERAVLVFLTLSSTRARIDLVERLAKQQVEVRASRDRILALTGRFSRLSPLRNRYNHCIYAFDDSEERIAKSIMMRVADRKSDIKVGLEQDIDQGALDEIRSNIAELQQINRDCWLLINDLGFPR